MLIAGICTLPFSTREAVRRLRREFLSETYGLQTTHGRVLWQESPKQREMAFVLRLAIT
jgi:hypothetical protein